MKQYKGIAIVCITVCLSAGLLAGCSNGGSATSSGNSESGTSESAASAASSEIMPVPDFSKLFKMSKKEAEEYLAEYPYEDYYGNGKVPLDEGMFGSSQDLADYVKTLSSDPDDIEPGSWTMRLDWPDDAKTCESASFEMVPLTNSSEEIAPSEEYAQMIESYFADYDIREMTIAKEDYAAGRSGWSGGPYYYGYVVFDDFVAILAGKAGTGYGVDLYPSSDSEVVSKIDKMKSTIANGYYNDVHSGGITYKIPIIDVYSFTNSKTSSSKQASSGTASSASSGTASSASASTATHDNVTGTVFCYGGQAPDAVNTVLISDDEIIIKGKLFREGEGAISSKTWSFGLDKNTEYGAVSGQGFKEMPKDTLISNWEACNFPQLMLDVENGMVKRIYQSS